MHTKVREAIAKRGLARSSIVVLDALLKLRQACCDPRLRKLSAANAARAKSARLERLVEMLPTMVEDGRRVLVFSQFTSMLALIEAELGAWGCPMSCSPGTRRAARIRSDGFGRALVTGILGAEAGRALALRRATWRRCWRRPRAEGLLTAM